MAQLTISSTSTEYILAPVSATVGGVRIDPTGNQVWMAFVPSGAVPGNSDWQSATWEVNTTTSPVTYSAKCLVGPSGGTITLTPAGYDVWTKIVDNPETAIKRCGPIRVI
jgi:hypothetical protein